MDEAVRHLRALYGLDPGVPHLAFQFPRLPPGPRGPFGPRADLPRMQLASQAASVTPGLRGFEHLYRQHAAGLLDGGGRPVPPGHPLYTGRGAAEVLRAENDALHRENLELKRRLGEGRDGAQADPARRYESL